MTALELQQHEAGDAREPVLDPVDRVSELCFGLFMALTFVGAVSAATSAPTSQNPHKVLFWTALGCNLAWGLADAVMFLVRTLTNRGRRITLAGAVRDERDPARGVELLRAELSAVLRGLVSDKELEAIRARLAQVQQLPEKPALTGRDYRGAVAIFILVVLGTFPVALPFILIEATPPALLVSRVLTMVMLFICGLALGRHTGSGGWKTGLGMVVLGCVLTAAIIALGG
ncbi:hypothetical protein HHL11_11470 [Ramlibacter sp. G-1-2-2]|uniref:VIT family protein n=1 Tax=Ramlibacter agri TaxID=2728837 RepID=A0A848H1D4_9BURK|nr:VIT1/CCC1 transporter family protein [Ramlibacter agri]NML44374.1 hypothetical protein [Ramlibacter agri]